MLGAVRDFALRRRPERGLACALERGRSLARALTGGLTSSAGEREWGATGAGAERDPHSHPHSRRPRNPYDIRKLEAKLAEASDQSAVWRTLLDNDKAVTPFLCLTGLKRVSKLINYGTRRADAALHRKVFQLVHETVEAQPGRCDQSTCASLLNYLKRVSLASREQLSPALERRLVDGFIANIAHSNKFSLGVFVSSMVHGADAQLSAGSSPSLDGGVWRKVNDRILAIGRAWNAKSALSLLHSLDALDKAGLSARPECWALLLDTFARCDFKAHFRATQNNPQHYNVVLRRVPAAEQQERLGSFFAAVVSEKLHGLLFNNRWRLVVEKMPEGLAAETVGAREVDRSLLSHLGRGKKLRAGQLVHALWAISTLGLPVSAFPLKKLVTAAQERYGEMSGEELARVLRSLVLLMEARAPGAGAAMADGGEGGGLPALDRAAYDLLLAYIAERAGDLGTATLCSVLHTVGLSGCHAQSEPAWKLIYVYLNSAYRRGQSLQRRSKRDASIMFAMGGLGRDSDNTREILRMCKLCLSQVDSFRNDQLKWSLDGLARITETHRLHEDFPEDHEQLHRRLLIAVKKKMQHCKLTSKQCAYILDAIVKSNAFIQSDMLEVTLVPDLVKQFLGRPLASPGDIVTVMAAIGEMETPVHEEDMTQLIHLVITEARNFSQEDLGRLLQSLSKVSNWYELDRYTQEDLMSLLWERDKFA